MRSSTWFKRLEIALDFQAGLEIFLLIGPGELARPALERILEELPRSGQPRWHLLHEEGYGALLERGPSGLIHLVYGFEQMPRAAASDMAARFNLNRDRLHFLAAPIIFWIPEDFFEELRTQAPDFVDWRSQATVVSLHELGLDTQSGAAHR